MSSSAYVESWRARYGDGAQVIADHRVVTRDGLEGRGMGLALDEEVTSLLGDSREVTPAQTLMCNGFTIESVPVIVGYLTPQSTDPGLVAAAEAILASLSRQMIPSASQTPRVCCVNRRASSASRSSSSGVPLSS